MQTRALVPKHAMSRPNLFGRVADGRAEVSEAGAGGSGARPLCCSGAGEQKRSLWSERPAPSAARHAASAGDDRGSSCEGASCPTSCPLPCSTPLTSLPLGSWPGTASRPPAPTGRTCGASSSGALAISARRWRRSVRTWSCTCATSSSAATPQPRSAAACRPFRLCSGTPSSTNSSPATPPWR